MSQPKQKDSSPQTERPRLAIVPQSAESANLSAQDETLLGIIILMSNSLQVMKDIISKANFIAVNASIEAARTQTQSENFTLVADQVRRQAERTEDLANGLGQEIFDLESYALKATAVRFADIASDIIDKIDRNLFERNCDCQAWAGFAENMSCVQKTFNLSGEQVRKLAEAGDQSVTETDAIRASKDLLKQLVDTYQVYRDVLLLNNKGVIVATAHDESLIGTDQSDRDFFKNVMTSGQVFVTDLYYSTSVKGHTVAYSAPVKDDAGNTVGVLSTRFSWDFVQEMIDKMAVDEAARIYVISSNGTLLASTNQLGILADNLAWLMAGESAAIGNTGFTIECARNGRLSAWGFCHTFGFGAYSGMGWSAVVSYPVNAQKNYFICNTIARDGVSNREAADSANHDLERVAESIKLRVKNINNINNETNMLAVNAAIQAGVAGAEGESFSVIASEIGKLARQSEDFVSKINSLTEKLGQSVRNTVFMRLGEAAFDTIDKIDRNLFERFCDVQAFAKFRDFIEFLRSEEKMSESVQDLLRRIHHIYEVYHDIYLLNTDGIIVGAAIHKEFLGQSQRDRDWFREALNGSIVVTDLYRSNSINDYTVTFAAPVQDASGNILGILTTRFNCNVIYDIMKATIVGKGSKVYLVNSKGVVIGSPSKDGILTDSFATSKSFRSLDNGIHGYINEPMGGDRHMCAVGYAKTKGYLTYKGKGWAVLIVRELTEEAESEG